MNNQCSLDLRISLPAPYVAALDEVATSMGGTRSSAARLALACGLDAALSLATFPTLKVPDRPPRRRQPLGKPPEGWGENQ